MAKLDRKDVKIFAEDCDNTLVAEFRTEDEVLGTASYSRDPDMIQNANYSQGWVEDTDNLNTKIYGEDLNAVNYVLSYLLKYLYENGIAEWKSTTTYYTNSIARVDDVLYISLIDDNTGNDPTSTVGCWRAVVLDTITSTIAGAGSDIVKGITGNQITFKSISVDGYASLTDNGDQLNIHVLGGGGIVDAFWGQIQGTLSNQTDLVSALGAKQDTITVDSPLSIDVNNEISIAKATTLASGYLDYNDFNTFNGKQDALTGFTHTYDSGEDEVTIEPSALNSNIGTDLAPITNLNGLHLKVDTIGNQTSGVGYIDFSSSINITNGNLKAWHIFHNYSDIQMAYTDEDDINFSLGTNEDTSTGSYYFNINDDTKLRITSNSIIPQADILPPNNTYDLGSSTRTFAEGYINNTISNTVTTDNYKNNINYTNPTTTFTDFNFGSTYYYYQGANNEMSILNIQSVYDGDTNTITDILPQKTNTSKSHYCSLGNSNQRFFEGYFRNLNTSTSITTPEIIGGQSDGTVKVQDIRLGTIRGYTAGASVTVNANTSFGNSSVTIDTIIGNNSGDNLYVKGRLYVLNGSTKVFQIGYGQAIPEGAAGSYNLGNNDNYFNGVYAKNFVTRPSDIREKENIKTYDKGVLDKLDNLNPITYTIKGDESKEVKFGISAQELRDVEPLCVVGEEKEPDENGKGAEYLGIDMYAINTLCIKAIKELNEKIKKLEARVKELEDK